MKKLRLDKVENNYDGPGGTSLGNKGQLNSGRRPEDLSIDLPSEHSS
tara:strand:- start:273 stop:413 length:141 start_codon:yes stop_codon:yes gene_type:complete